MLAFTVGVRAALIGCTLVALCPFLIFYSTEARPYALMVLLVLLSTLALLRAVRSGGFAAWAAYAVFACAAAYTHFTAVFPLAAQLIWVLVTQPGDAPGRSSPVSRPGSVIFRAADPDQDQRIPGTKLYGFLEPFSLRSIRVDPGAGRSGTRSLPCRSYPGRWRRGWRLRPS